MKKIIITLVLAALPTLMFAQSPFAKFEGKDDITTVVVNKKLFDIIKEMGIDVKVEDKQAADYLKYVEKLDNIRVYTTTNKKYTAEMKSSVKDYLKSNPLEELVSVNDEGKQIKVYVKTGAEASDIREMLVFVEGGDKDEETVLVSLTASM